MIIAILSQVYLHFIIGSEQIKTNYKRENQKEKLNDYAESIMIVAIFNFISAYVAYTLEPKGVLEKDSSMVIWLLSIFLFSFSIKASLSILTQQKKYTPIVLSIVKILIASYWIWI